MSNVRRESGSVWGTRTTKGLYAYSLDCGRSGTLVGLFVANRDEVERARVSDIYFGEVLGKHSEVSQEPNEGEYTLISEELAVVHRFEENHGSFLGVNPVSSLQYPAYTEE